MKTTKNQVIAFTFALLVITLTSCEKSMFGIEGEGSRVTQEFTYAEITGISMNIEGNVHLTQADTQLITIKAQQNIINNMEMTMHNGILDIEFDKNVKNHDGIDIYMSIKTLTEAKLSGSGNISTTNLFKGDDLLHLSLSGSGNFNFKADAPEIYSNISGSGDFTINTNTEYFQGGISGSGKYIMVGSTNEAEYSISGSGEISAYDLHSEQTSIDVSGTGNSRVNVSNKLIVKISGSGDVYYLGIPTIESNISGSGSIHNSN